MVFSSLPLVVTPVVYSFVTSYNQSGPLDPLSPSPPLKVDLSILPEMLLLVLITRGLQNLGRGESSEDSE